MFLKGYFSMTNNLNMSAQSGFFLRIILENLKKKNFGVHINTSRMSKKYQKCYFGQLFDINGSFGNLK